MFSFNNFSLELALKIHEYLPNVVNLSLTCKYQYYILWDEVGCYTQLLYDDIEIEYDSEEERMYYKQIKDDKKEEKEYHKRYS